MLKGQLPLSVVISSVILPALLCLGYFFLRPMSGDFLAYLLWSTSRQAHPTAGRVTVGDADIHYVCYGKGPALLLLHGGLSNRLSWFSQIPWLVETGHQVVLLDTRGHGDSGLGRSELTYRLLAADAVAVLDRLQLHRVDVIGWSDGGNTALTLGRYWPQRIHRIVAISANFNPSGLTAEARREAREETGGLNYWFKRWWTGAGERWRELEVRVKKMWLHGPTLQASDLRVITAPCLVLVGEHDLVSIEHAREMSRLLVHGCLEVLPGGHFTPVSQAPLVNGLIGEFLGIPLPGEEGDFPGHVNR